MNTNMITNAYADSTTFTHTNTLAITAEHDILVTDVVRGRGPGVGKKIGNALASVLLTCLCGCAGPAAFGYDTLLHKDYVERRLSSLGSAGSSKSDITLSPAGSSRKIWIED